MAQSVTDGGRDVPFVIDAGSSAPGWAIRQMLTRTSYVESREIRDAKVYWILALAVR